MNKLNENKYFTSKNKMGVLAIEKRKHPRFSVELPLDYSRIEGKETYGGIVANASEGGILVYLSERMEIGTLLKIEIFYVRGLEFDTIKAIAKVVWSDLAARESWGEYRYGLQFQSIDEKDFVRLITLLKEIGK
jgi:c-di-GMP-binding flagellar brake protein YcgR